MSDFFTPTRDEQTRPAEQDENERIERSGDELMRNFGATALGSVKSENGIRASAAKIQNEFSMQNSNEVTPPMVDPSEILAESHEIDVRIHKTYDETVNAITHPAPHHADEVFATAMLSTLFPVELYRTRNQNIINDTNAIVYDVGGGFEFAGKKRFDHHQRGFTEVRPDGTKYSSAGLIWREYGAGIVKRVNKSVDDEMVAEIVSKIDDNLIKDIDARDNGQGKKDPNSISSTLASFNTLWNENEYADELFVKACEIASAILEREIKTAVSFAVGRKMVGERIEEADGPILVLDKFIGGWLDGVLNSDDPKAKELLFAVYPALSGNWNVQAIPPTAEDTMGQRKSLPEMWRGLNGQEFAEISGVDSAVFCHVAGFIAAARTREDAMKLAKKAVDS